VNKQKSTETNLESLMNLLENRNAATRMKARKSLVAMGKPAVSSLAGALQYSKLEHVRWEAAKTLGAIGDIRAIPSLVKALGDDNSDVTWLAAEALRKFKKRAWPPLLRALVKSKQDSVLLRTGAHHVLQNQNDDGFNDLLSTLRNALESNSAPESTPLAASDFLNRLKIKS
jgi:HEAT repeat protein